MICFMIFVLFFGMTKLIAFRLNINNDIWDKFKQELYVRITQTENDITVNKSGDLIIGFTCSNYIIEFMTVKESFNPEFSDMFIQTTGIFLSCEWTKQFGNMANLGIETEYTVLEHKTFILYTDTHRDEFMKFIKPIADRMLMYQTTKPVISNQRYDCYFNKEITIDFEMVSIRIKFAPHRVFEESNHKIYMCGQELDFMTRFVFYQESVDSRIEFIKMANDDFEKYFDDTAKEIAENMSTEPN